MTWESMTYIKGYRRQAIKEHWKILCKKIFKWRSMKISVNLLSYSNDLTLLPLCAAVPFYGFYILRTLLIFHISKALSLSFERHEFMSVHEIIFHHFQSLGLFCRKMFIPSLEVEQFLWFFNCECSRKKRKEMRIIKNRREAARKINELYDEEKKNTWWRARWAGNNVEAIFISLDSNVASRLIFLGSLADYKTK